MDRRKTGDKPLCFLSVQWCYTVHNARKGAFSAQGWKKEPKFSLARESIGNVGQKSGRQSGSCFIKECTKYNWELPVSYNPLLPQNNWNNSPNLGKPCFLLRISFILLFPTYILYAQNARKKPSSELLLPINNIFIYILENPLVACSRWSEPCVALLS